MSKRDLVLDSGGRLSVGARATFCARLMEKYTFSIVFREVPTFFNGFENCASFPYTCHSSDVSIISGSTFAVAREHACVFSAQKIYLMGS